MVKLVKTGNDRSRVAGRLQRDVGRQAHDVAPRLAIDHVGLRWPVLRLSVFPEEHRRAPMQVQEGSARLAADRSTTTPSSACSRTPRYVPCYLLRTSADQQYRSAAMRAL